MCFDPYFRAFRSAAERRFQRCDHRGRRAAVHSQWPPRPPHTQTGRLLRVHGTARARSGPGTQLGCLCGKRTAFPAPDTDRSRRPAAGHAAAHCADVPPSPQRLCRLRLVRGQGPAGIAGRRPVRRGPASGAEPLFGGRPRDIPAGIHGGQSGVVSGLCRGWSASGTFYPDCPASGRRIRAGPPAPLPLEDGNAGLPCGLCPGPEDGLCHIPVRPGWTEKQPQIRYYDEEAMQWQETWCAPARS